MMRMIVLTDGVFSSGEADAIRMLLEEGVDRIHLRKPQATEGEMRRLIESLPAAEYPRMSLQDHLPLAVEYGIGGIHLNARNGEVPAGFGGLVSRSCHTLGEIAAYPQEDYLFLSPIYDSISKQGYRSNYSPERLCRAAAEGAISSRIVALGGVRPEYLPELAAYGFGGAAFLGYVWQAISPQQMRRRIRLIRKYLK